MGYQVLRCASIVFADVSIPNIVTLENGIGAAAFTVLCFVIKVLWKKTEDNNKYILDELEATKLRLNACEATKLEFIKSSLEETLELSSRIKELEQKQKANHDFDKSKH